MSCLCVCKYKALWCVCVCNMGYSGVGVDGWCEE